MYNICEESYTQGVVAVDVAVVCLRSIYDHEIGNNTKEQPQRLTE